MLKKIIKVFSNFLQDLLNPKDIYGCFRLLFTRGLIFGLTPFHVAETPNKRELRASVFGYLSICMRFILYFYCFSHSFMRQQSFASFIFQTSISYFTDAFRRLNGFVGIMLVLFTCLKYKRSLQRLMGQLYDLEKRFIHLGIIFHQKTAAFFINSLIVFGVLLNISFVCCTHFFIVHSNGIYVSLPIMITFYAPNHTICGLLILYGGVLYKIRSYLRALNKVLKNLSKQWEKNAIRTISSKQRSPQHFNSFSMYTIATKSPSKIVQECMEIHLLICRAAATANKYFTYQLLTIICAAFLIIVFDAYYVFETLLGESKRKSKFKTMEFLIYFSCQMILFSIAFISIVECSNRAIKKSVKTGGIVHMLLNKTKNPEVKQKLQQFSMQLLHVKIHFTAAGLFSIDRSLYFTISGALTTYLIILLQSTAHISNKLNGLKDFGVSQNITSSMP